METVSDDVIIAFIKKLPAILKKHPELRKTLLDTLDVPANLGDTIQAILLELKKLREDFNKQFKAFSKRMDAVERALLSLDRKITALEVMCGIDSEASFRNAMKGLLEEDFGVSVERWEYYDKEGFVYWRPSTVEVDVVIKDSKHILIEIKSSVSKNDVAMFLKKGELYRRVTGIEPELMIVSPFINPYAEAYAKDNNVKIYTKT